MVAGQGAWSVVPEPCAGQEKQEGVDTEHFLPIAPNQNNNVFAQLVLTREETQIEGPFFSWFLYPEFPFKIDVCADGWVYRLVV